MISNIINICLIMIYFNRHFGKSYKFKSDINIKLIYELLLYFSLLRSKRFIENNPHIVFSRVKQLLCKNVTLPY